MIFPYSVGGLASDDVVNCGNIVQAMCDACRHGMFDKIGQLHARDLGGGDYCSQLFSDSEYDY